MNQNVPQVTTEKQHYIGSLGGLNVFQNQYPDSLVCHWLHDSVVCCKQGKMFQSALLL